MAARYLEQRGYTIRERNFRCPHGEIDLIAVKDEYLVFVEVKTRGAKTPYHPTLAMTEDKMQRVRRLGEFYCAEHPQPHLQPRFDVVAVTFAGRGQAGGTQVEHYVNAF